MAEDTIKTVQDEELKSHKDISPKSEIVSNLNYNNIELPRGSYLGVTLQHQQ